MTSEIVDDGTIALAMMVPSQAAAGRRERTSDDISKRCVDITIALLAILLLCPLIICIALLIRKSGSSVIFAHRRVGRRGVPFRCYKFQSMVANADDVLAAYLAVNPEAALEWQTKRKLKCDPRVTRLGRVLRESSVDELPQLFNILFGHMSFVGPRPIVFEELEHYGAAARDYLSTKPGLTGLWQVSGRNALSFAERVEFDRRYVRDRSLIHDLSIMARTVPEVMWRRQTS